MKSARIRTASGAGTASGLQIASRSPDVRANAAFRLAAYERGRSFSITRAPCRSRGRLPGKFETRTSSSTCGASAGSASSSSRACPCETTTPEMRLAVAIDLHPVSRLLLEQGLELGVEGLAPRPDLPLTERRARAREEPLEEARRHGQSEVVVDRANRPRLRRVATAAARADQLLEPHHERAAVEPAGERSQQALEGWRRWPC